MILGVIIFQIGTTFYANGDFVAAGDMIERVLDILALLADHPQGLPISDVSRQLDLPKSAVHRLLSDWPHAPVIGRLSLVEGDALIWIAKAQGAWLGHLHPGRRARHVRGRLRDHGPSKPTRDRHRQRDRSRGATPTGAPRPIAPDVQATAAEIADLWPSRKVMEAMMD